MEIEDKIVEILKNNNIKPILSGDPNLLATIRIYENEETVDKVLGELESLFKNYSSYSISSTHVSSCCAPSFEEIRYKVVF